MTVGVMSRIRVLVVESHPLLRGGLEAVLSANDDMTVTAAVCGIEQALHVIPHSPPDVVVFGIDERGHEVNGSLARLLAVGVGQRVVILGQGDRPGHAESLLQQGVRAYLPKDVSRDHLTSVIREICREGERVFISASPSALPSLTRSGGTVLSKREREVILLVADAMSNAQIARKLSITKGTVKRHLHNIFAKLNAVSRIDAVNKARAVMMIATTIRLDS
ncbi:two component transcriptional regulator, LuxR family [Micromonospora matsumotoense]|uniref:Two component transcriptional regulator, LuxR family n=1 Tax=Micromonospora matsumotoense TaxID=121616 RepID=A0A1C5A2S2_9ACTN|nr:response regulator transcription factor [Micromonospora matsumotoense]SCF39391.1 two component transcriptional regulator, LuxR family [Micromonospora matsumotoense]